MKRLLALLTVIIILTMSACSLRGVGEAPATDTADYSTAAPVTEAATEPETTAKKEDEIFKASFVGCGDNIIYFGTYRDAKAQAVAGGREYNFKPIYENVQGVISAADIAFINQETVIADSFPPESYPTFNSPVDLADDLCEVGFDVINIANNHMLDKGAQGLHETYLNWKKRNVELIGCWEENAAGKYITYYEKNGIKIGFVSYTYGTNLGEDPAKFGLYAPYIKYADIEGEISEARKNSDFVIASVHWGTENSGEVNDEQRAYAQRMAQSGADVIIGHHPHTLQPIEWLDGNDGGKCLVVYSLGNFVHEQDRQHQVVGGMICFDIEKINDERAAAQNIQFVPTVCHYPSNFYNNKVYLLRDYTAELANAHAVRTYYGNEISLEGLYKKVTDTIDGEFLPDYMK